MADAWRSLSFRRRLTVAGAVAVAAAVALAAAVTYVVVRAELRAQVDEDLHANADRLGERFAVALPEGSSERALGLLDVAPEGPAIALRDGNVRRRLLLPAPALGGPRGYAQLVTTAGEAIGPPGDGEVVLRPDAAARRVARGDASEALSDAVVDGTPVRVLTTALGPDVALQLAQPVDDVDATLTRLAWILALVSLGGVGLAVALGLVVTRTALAPVVELTEAAEHVARTRDLSRRIAVVGDDELGRLADSFNAMLGELEDSARAQRQLVADASHELRTPLTSLRTNLEVLAAGGDRDAADDPAAAAYRALLLRDVVAQLEELSALVGDLVELARDEDVARETEPVRLDELVAGAVERARRRHPDQGFATDLTAVTVEGVPAQLDRAVANLLDNARKWSPPGRPVEVAVAAGGRVAVRDHGPGIAPEDAGRVFDRFYRAPSARGTPGSGLGLAIVRAVADSHGGRVAVAAAIGGGALLTLEIPVADPRYVAGDALSRSLAASQAALRSPGSDGRHDQIERE
jgi:two-component system sensor histidine kinase MprB